MAEDLLDLGGLRSLYGEDAVQELLELSVKEVGQLVAQLDEALLKHDADKAVQAAHTLKGLSSTMTIKSLFELSRDLESSLRSGEWDESKQMFAAMKDLSAKVQEHLTSLLAKPG